MFAGKSEKKQMAPFLCMLLGTNPRMPLMFLIRNRMRASLLRCPRKYCATQLQETTTQNSSSAIRSSKIVRIAIDINSLCKANKLEEARQAIEGIFKAGLKPTPSCCSPLISVYLNNNSPIELFDIVKYLSSNGVKLPTKTYNATIKSLFAISEHSKAHYIVNMMKNTPIPFDCTTYTLLIQSYTKNQNFEAARGFIQEFLTSSIRIDTIAMNVVLKYYVMTDQYRETKNLFEFFAKVKKVPFDTASFELFVKGELQIPNFDRAAQILRSQTKTTKTINAKPYNLLLNGIPENQRQTKASEIYEEMKGNGVKPDKYTISILLKIFDKSLSQAALVFIDALANDIELDSVAYTSYMDACIHGNRVDKAMEIFEGLQSGKYKKSSPAIDEVMRRTLALASAKIGSVSNIIKVFNQVGTLTEEQNKFYFSTLLEAAIISSDVEKVIQMLESMEDTKELPNKVIEGCGRLLESPEHGKRLEEFLLDQLNTKQWIVLLESCLKDNNDDQAQIILQKMKSQPFDASLLQQTVQACFKQKHLELGKTLLREAVLQKHLDTEQMNKVVKSCLGTRQVECAREIVREMTTTYKLGDFDTFRLFLHHYGKHNNKRETIRTFKQMKLKECCFLAEDIEVYVGVLGDKEKLQEVVELMSKWKTKVTPKLYKIILNKQCSLGDYSSALVFWRLYKELEPGLTSTARGIALYLLNKKFDKAAELVKAENLTEQQWKLVFSILSSHSTDSISLLSSLCKQLPAKPWNNFTSPVFNKTKNLVNSCTPLIKE